MTAVFIQTEDTPNPQTLKFVPGRTVLENGTYEFKSRDEAWRSMLSKVLFDIAGIASLYFAKDFISVTKSPDVEWAHLKPAILGAIMDYYLAHDHVTLIQDSEPAAIDESEMGQIEKEIRDLIDQRVRPAVAQDGGDIVFDRFENGTVYVQLKGACSGCPSSSATLKSGIENMLRHYIPEVQAVEAIPTHI